MANLLAMDSANAGCSAAVLKDGEVMACESTPMSRGQSEALMPMAARVMQAAALDFADLGAIAVTVGPGAFTGLRIGLSAARAMATALAVPCVGVSTFDAVRHSANAETQDARPMLVVLDSKRDDVYVTLFGADGNTLLQGQALPAADIVDHVCNHLGTNDVLDVVGDGFDAVVRALHARNVNVERVPGTHDPDAYHVALIAHRILQSGKIITPAEPVYLRPPDAKPQPQPAVIVFE